MKNLMVDFEVLKSFQVIVELPKVPSIKQLMWYPPLLEWFKWNSNGATKGALGPGGCSGLFKNSYGVVLGC